MSDTHNPSVFETQEDYFSKDIFADMAKWGRMLSIIGLATLGLYALLLLIAGGTINYALESMSSQLGARAGMVAALLRFGGAAFVVIILIVMAIVGLLVWFLYRGTTRIRRGIAHDDQGLFNSGLSYLKNYFVMWTVFSAISLLFTLIGMVS